MQIRKPLSNACLILLLAAILMSILALVPNNAYPHQLIPSLPSLSNPTQSKTCPPYCTIGSNGFSLIRTFEGFSPFTYSDVGGIPTIGFGHAIRTGERFIEPISGQQAQELLERDTHAAVTTLSRLIKPSTTQNQFDALTSFTYNVGVGTFMRSSVLRKHNDLDDAGASAALLRYDHVGGKVVRGLTARRNLEAKLYLMD